MLKDVSESGDVMNKVKLEGLFFDTNNFGQVKVIEYTNNMKVLVEFVKSEYRTTTSLCNIQKGNVKDRLQPSVCNVGVIGVGVKTKVNSVKLYEYTLWVGMLRRCYDSETQEHQTTYRGCSVSENFKYYPYFYNWCNNQIGFNSVDDKGKPFSLDKDILTKGNKIYSEDNCVFVPQEINNLLLSNNKIRGKFPIGVSFHKGVGKFAANINKSRNPIHIGYFTTQEEAFLAYKNAKESYIKEAANKWKDDIDSRVYEALINYQVEITD